MAEVMYGLVSEARKNRFSAIPKLAAEGKKLIKLTKESIFNSFVVGVDCFVKSCFKSA